MKKWIFDKSKYMNNNTLNLTVDILHFRERTLSHWRGTCLFISLRRVWPSCGHPISWWTAVVRTQMMKSIAGKQSNQQKFFYFMLWIHVILQFMCTFCLINYIYLNKIFFSMIKVILFLFNVGYNYGRIVCLGML